MSESSGGQKKDMVSITGLFKSDGPKEYWSGKSREELVIPAGSKFWLFQKEGRFSLCFTPPREGGYDAGVRQAKPTKSKDDYPF